MKQESESQRLHTYMLAGKALGNSTKKLLIQRYVYLFNEHGII